MTNSATGLRALISAAGFMIVAASGPSLAAAQPGAPDERTLTVTGEGSVKAVPDEAHLSAGVVSEAPRASDALAANSRAMKEVFAALTRLGIPDHAIQTSSFSVNPQYATDRSGNESSKISGYRVSNEVTVTVEGTLKLGAAIDALVNSGANSMGSITFAIRDPQPLLAEARTQAVKDAVARAATYASAAGVTLGPVLAISEAGSEMPRPFAMQRLQMAAAPAPIAAGEESVSATVNVTFAIR